MPSACASSISSATHSLWSRIRNVVPRPSSLFTSIRPPCASTMPFAIGSPRPTPSRRRRSACQNRSKIRDTCSGGMPGPVSLTLISTPLGIGSAASVTVPALGVNLIALPSRLPSACVRRFGSTYAEPSAGERERRTSICLPAAMLPRARRAADRMRVLIEDLLQLSQIDAGTLVINPMPVQLGSLLDDVYEQHRLLAAGKQIEVRRSLSPALGSAYVDPNRLTQALGNLLGNAIKFTPSAGTVTLAAEPMPNGVEISVSDTGPGIPPEQVSRIFDRFWLVVCCC